MNNLTIKIFDKTPQTTVMRLLSASGNLIADRELERTQVDAWIAQVERDYTDASPALDALGRRLYDWLDSSEHRWLAKAIAEHTALCLHIDTAERLRHLPWELLRQDGVFLCANLFRPFGPVHLVNDMQSPAVRANRPLRILFMACSPEDVKPVLDFEKEERGILDATQHHSMELVVEESGSLAGLEERIEAFDQGHYDVFHLTGHAGLDGTTPIFCMENDLGFEQTATAEDIARVFKGHWPRLVFLSGCETGQAASHGVLPSFCEALVQAGAPAVLGWALPVYDTTGNLASSEVYGQLAIGQRVDEAVAHTRRRLFEEQAPDWHLLRLFANATPLSELVTPPQTRGRARLHVREAATEFFDAGAKMEVCSRAHFVGRRRIIQRCLRVLRSRQGEPGHAEGVLLHGMGGLGKSSLAARLCERMTDYRRLVWVGAVDEMELCRVLSERLDSPEVITILNTTELNLQQRMRRLFEGPLATSPVLFIFDDFEHNLDQDSDGRPLLKPGTRDIIIAVLGAIRDVASESRLIITCRHTFPLAGPARLHSECLESMRGPELRKKMGFLPSFAENTSVPKELRAKALGLADGNPRLLERLDKVLADTGTDHDAILAAMERKEVEFREDILLEELVRRLPGEARKTLAILAVYHLPIPQEAVAAAADNAGVAPHLERAVALSLAEAGKDPASHHPLYYVSRVAAPAIENELTTPEHLEACRRAARYLYKTWYVEADSTLIERAIEIHRLSLVAHEDVIAADISVPVSAAWNRQSRFREAEFLCRLTLAVIEDYRVLHQLAYSETILGKTQDALTHYERALELCPKRDVAENQAARAERGHILYDLAQLLVQFGRIPEAMDFYQESAEINDELDDSQGKAATLHNMAVVIAQQGDVARALELWNQSLEIKERINDVQGKAVTLSSMADMIARQGDTARALELWNQSLEIKERIGNMQGKATTLSSMAGVIAQQGDTARALELWNQSLEISEQIGDVQGKAVTLSSMADVIALQGDVARALELWNQSLELLERTGDVKSKAATLNNMADVIALQGDVARALELWNYSLELKEQIGDIRGKAATLNNMAGVMAQQGNIARALELLNQSLEVLDRIGEVKGKAAALHNMAGVIAQQGDIARALELWNQSLEISERIEDVKGKAATLNNMAGVMAQQGDMAHALELWNQSLELKERIEDVRGKAVTLDNMAGVMAQQGDIAHALELWNQSLELLERIGDMQGKAVTLSKMAAVLAQQGEFARALELWNQSLEISEQIGDVQGKAVTLSSMAGVIALQGDVAHALELWNQSLELLERTGDVKNKAATLNNMAGPIAQQGDIARALELWNQSLELLERTGDVKGKATMLANMAWVTGKQGNHIRECELYTQAVRALASIGAWLDCVTVLGNLGASEESDADGNLAQAAWLSLRVQVSVQAVTALGTRLFSKVTPVSEAAPLLATWVMFIIQSRGEKHPKKEELQRVASALLAACMDVRGIPQEEFAVWMAKERLNDPGYFLPALSRALETMVPEDAWLFDRSVFQSTPPQS